MEGRRGRPSAPVCSRLGAYLHSRARSQVSLPVRISTIRALIKEISVSAQVDRPLVVGGARALVPTLRAKLGIGGSDDPRGAAAYVHVWADDGSDEAALKRARRARVPIVAVVPEEIGDVPFVLATDVIRLRPGEGFPIPAIARTIAARLGEDAAPLAGRVPVLRDAVAQELITSFARKNALVAAAVFIPGVDLPVLLRNELRLVLRLHQTYGRSPDPRERLPEVGATVGAAFALRTVARELLDLVPVAGWALKGAVAYAGTRAVGEAALRRLQAGASRGAP
jgi:uncharacterized protein (DUF697 family)